MAKEKSKVTEAKETTEENKKNKKIVKMNVKHNGKMYVAGEVFDGSAEDEKALKEIGAL